MRRLILCLVTFASHFFFKLRMKFYLFFALAIAASPFLNSCSSGSVGENYDVSNPYAAPDYPDENASPYQGSENVNPAYNEPAVYEDTAAYEAPNTDVQQQATSVRGKVHTVVRGDTLWGLSRKYGVSIDQIKAANGLTSDVAVLGARLQIPAL